MRCIKRLLCLTGLFAGLHVLGAPCPSTGVNPITDTNWACTFPMQIAGTLSFGSDDNNQAQDAQNNTPPICVCDAGNGAYNVGLTVSYWEPSRLIDTVTDPYCMMPLGAKIADADGKLGGTNGRSATGATKAFSQMHYYIYPVWAMLDMFTDLPCIDRSEFDVAMMTEVLPTWNNDILALLVNPEAVLFANPAAALACMADSAAALKGYPIDLLFWCMGSWGNAYPLAGGITNSDFVAANAGIAARGTYLMGRSGLLRTSSDDGCTMRFSPIWRKSHYKYQLMKPVRQNECLPIGRTGLLWSGHKNPIATSDNFAWMKFRKVTCCATYY